jgi:hypothetical protein
VTTASGDLPRSANSKNLRRLWLQHAASLIRAGFALCVIGITEPGRSIGLEDPGIGGEMAVRVGELLGEVDPGSAGAARASIRRRLGSPPKRRRRRQSRSADAEWCGCQNLRGVAPKSDAVRCIDAIFAIEREINGAAV